MTVVREDVVCAARTWLGTPFHHQGRLKDIGVDCAGVVVGVAAQLELSAFDTNGYGRRPDSRELQHICDSQMRRVNLNDALPGDVYLIEVDGQPHAYAPARRVVEHRLDQAWADRLIAAYVLPGVA